MKYVDVIKMNIIKNNLEIDYQYEQLDNPVTHRFVIKNKEEVACKGKVIQDIGNKGIFKISINLDELIDDIESRKTFRIYVDILNELYKINLNQRYIFEYIENVRWNNEQCYYISKQNMKIYPVIYSDRAIGLECSLVDNKIKELDIKQDYVLSPFKDNNLNLAFYASETLLNANFVYKNKLYFDIDEKTILQYVDYKIVMKDRKNEQAWESKLYNSEELKLNIDLIKIINGLEITNKNRFDFYIVYEKNNVRLASRLKVKDIRFKSKSERYLTEIPLFDNSNTEELLYIVPYIRRDRQLSTIFLNERELIGEKAEIISTNMSRYGKKICFKMIMECLEGMPHKLVLMHRNNHDKNEIILPIKVGSIREGIFSVKVNIDCSKLELEQFYWDVYVSVIKDHKEALVRVKNPTKLLKRKLYTDIRNPISINHYIMMPYITKGNSISLIYRQENQYDSMYYRCKEHFAYLIFKVLKNIIKRKHIWIVYEKYSSSAQDNSYYFFKYCNDYKKTKNVYYIINKRADDCRRLKKYKKNVLYFMSLKHMIYILGAEMLVSAEARGHCYGWRQYNSRVIRSLNKKKLVFLQHGVIGLKRVDNVYHKRGGNPVNLFVVSSDYEKDIIKNYFGYEDKEIITTGLCRWDVLEDRRGSIKEILLMPTWRNWLDEVSDEVFRKSDYYIQYYQLLNNKQFQEMLKKSNIVVNFYIHPKFRDYMKEFEVANEHVKLISFGEQPLNELIMKCSLLITDYSSVSWDVYYQGKPVIFYQFDYKDYDENQGSYMDMNTEIFGDRTFEISQLIHSIQYYVDNGFREKDEYKNKRKYYFKWQDQNNSKRVYEEIEKAFF